MTAQPPLAPDELVAGAGERAVLEAFLDLYRDIVVRKATGISDESARARRVPSATTIAGVVKHLAAIEDEWFIGVLGGTTTATAADDGWTVDPDESIAAILESYRGACDRSRAIAARLDLDDAVAHPRLHRVSLRWVYVHMVEETARHAGHLDILREQTDGATGFDG
jgi:uncharacterized damage-inducible protein DinB